MTISAVAAPTVASLWREAIGHMGDRAWRPVWGLAIVAGLVITVGVAHYVPEINAGSSDIGLALTIVVGGVFLILALNALSIAAYRTACDSVRPAWRFDGAWWLHLLIFAIVYGTIETLVPGDNREAGWHGLALNQLLWLVVSVVIARWVVAIGVEPRIPSLFTALRQLPRYALPLAIALLPVVALNVASELLLRQVLDTPIGTLTMHAIVFMLASTIAMMAEIALAVALYRQTDIEPSGAAG